MTMRLILFFSLISGIFLFACKSGTSSGPQVKPADFSALPSDFLSFYQKFHTDSAYQMAHIQWPLKGDRAEKDSSGVGHKVLAVWEPAQWKMLHLPDMSDPGLKRYYETLGDAFVIERLQYPMVNYGMERQFFKDENNEWQMISYSEMQELK